MAQHDNEAVVDGIAGLGAQSHRAAANLGIVSLQPLFDGAAPAIVQAQHPDAAIGRQFVYVRVQPNLECLALVAFYCEARPRKQEKRRAATSRC